MFLSPSAEPKKRLCKVQFDYNPVNEDELELKVGDVVDILEEVHQTRTQQLDYFFQDVQKRFAADFRSLPFGFFWVFLGQVEEGWWSGSVNGKSGVFPSNFVKELDAAGDEPESNSAAADEAGKSG